jgi:hypothetical protein
MSASRSKQHKPTKLDDSETEGCVMSSDVPAFYGGNRILIEPQSDKTKVKHGKKGKDN